MENFGEQLKNLRKESGISQSELAEKLGVHLQTVSKWERGIMLPDVGQFGDIAKALDVPLETLLMQPIGEKQYVGEFSVPALSEKIIELRRKRGLSQSDVAEAVGCSSRRCIEMGTRRNLPVHRQHNRLVARVRRAVVRAVFQRSAQKSSR